MAQLSVTVSIIAGNEVDRIAEAVASARWAHEVVVLDSCSEDGTADRARAAGARVVVEPWRGYGLQKNRAAELASTEWVFSLDADERIDPRLAAAIGALPDAPRCAAYAVSRHNHFAGRPVPRWPWVSDRTLRLYDRRRACFSARPVHEALEVAGPTGLLPGRLEHLGERSWREYRDRREHYAALGAAAAAERGRLPRAGDLTLRPAAAFLRHWLLRGYLLGGSWGLRLSLEAARGTRRKYELLRQRSATDLRG